MSAAFKEQRLKEAAHLRGKWPDSVILGAYVSKFGVLYHDKHGYLEDPIPELRRYWSDPKVRAERDTEKRNQQAEWEAAWAADRERIWGAGA